MESLQVVKHGCTAMNLREKHRAEHGCPKEETRLESQKKKNRSQKKALYTLFFSSRGFVLPKHVMRRSASLGNTSESLRLLRSTVFTREKQTNKPKTGLRGIKLLHDHAPVDKYKLVRKYLGNDNVETLPHSPYSPHFAPCDFFFFPHLKKCLSGKFLKR